MLARRIRSRQKKSRGHTPKFTTLNLYPRPRPAFDKFRLNFDQVVTERTFYRPATVQGDYAQRDKSYDPIQLNYNKR